MTGGTEGAGTGAGPWGGGAVRTVLGDIPGDLLGVCDAHAHLFLRTPASPGEELADQDAAEAESAAFAEAGGTAAVQWTPYGMGRSAGALAEIARRTGLHLVAATGLHQAVHYAGQERGQAGQPAGPGTQVADLARLFVDELTLGVSRSVCGEAPRAGLIKVAGALGGLDDHASRTLHAAAEAHHATGAPVAVHLDGGTAAHDVLDLLCDRRGVPPHRVLLGHPGRLPDPRLHLALARRGAWLVFDGPSRAHHATDLRLADCITALVDRGHADSVLLGSDTTTAAERGAPGMRHLPEVLLPRIARESGKETAERISVRNPARAFAADWKE
ncbi:phosphotriesterase [Streptomyces sp. HNM0575]|uniref:phosphotriesterase family protein n=1 Tax=Streptomyces sp. HNM0575 TaxID=2716338 RepID=UPI00145F419A|nr:phosphotriesterase [Streptomyces sp. HNM0575]NLU76504.1 phosphotriesterase [Streptomyces sp. HNM0575]